MKLTLDNVKKLPEIEAFIDRTHEYLKWLSYTEHAHRHIQIVSSRASSLAKKLGFSQQDQEYCAISGYCHDMGNFVGRTQHHYWGSLLFMQALMPKVDDYDGCTKIAQAIVAHDKEDTKIMTNISAVLIISDKSDVHRDRVLKKDYEKMSTDIHTRVNYSVTKNALDYNEKTKVISLKLKVDTKIVPVMEFFEIFTERMTYCRQSADFLGVKFGLVINDFKLL